MVNVDHVTNVANLLRSASQTATTSSQGMTHPSSFLDVWSHTYDGMVRRINDFSNDPVGSLHRYQEDSDQAIQAGLTGEWQHSSLDNTWNSISAQATALGDGLNAISKADGALATIGASFAFLVSIEQMLSTVVSAIPFPAMPALRILDIDIGLPHAHNHPPNLTPPNLVPVPLPSTGPVIPIPILSGANSTTINGMPAARCGDMGLGIWCGGYFPMYEVFLGSSNVWIEGARAARLAVDITKHCTFTSPKPSDPPLGPMIGFTVTASTNVLIGGVPMPSLLSLAFAAAFKALFKGLGKLVNRLRQARRAVRPHAPHAPTSSSAANLRGNLPSGFFPPQWTRRVQDIYNRLLRVEGEIVTGGRMPLPEGITAGELAQLTRATGREFGVVLDESGKLHLVTGATDHVPVGAADQTLVHTHPAPYHTYASDVSQGDVGHAAGVADQTGFEHPQAVVDCDGNVHHFDRNGVVDNPNYSPIHQDGSIDGVHSHTSGAPMHAIPPRMI